VLRNRVNIFLVTIRRGGIPLLLGVLTFLAAGILPISWLTIFLVVFFAIIGALEFRGSLIEKFGWGIMPLWAMAAASWSGLALGAFWGALLTISLRGLERKRSKNFSWLVAAFFVILNAFVFSSQSIDKGMLFFLFLSVTISLGIVLRAHLEGNFSQETSDWPTFVALLILLLELIFVLQLLPYGYLSLAAIALIWYSLIVTLEGEKLAGKISKQLVSQELLLAALLTILIAVSSGIKPR
jgi:hypothetical protein